VFLEHTWAFCVLGPYTALWFTLTGPFNGIWKLHIFIAWFLIVTYIHTSRSSLSRNGIYFFK